MASRDLALFVTLTLIEVWIGPTRAFAQGQPLREMHHASWTAREGAPQAIIELAQHPDGTLWIGSEGGLFNFDGQTFRPFLSVSGDPELPSSEVYSLLITKGGTIWVSFYRMGIARIAAGRVTVFSHVETEPFVAVRQLREAPDGSIWAFDRQHLIRFGGDGMWRREPTPVSASIGGIVIDAMNTLWLAQDRVLHRRPLAQAQYTRTAVPADVVTGFAMTSSGDIWINDYDPTTSRGRTQQVSSAGRLIRVLPQSLFTTGSLVSTADGALIVASFAAGVRRFSSDELSSQSGEHVKRQADVFTREHGLSSSTTSAVIVDSHGNIWIGGARGLDRLRSAQLTKYLGAAEGSGWAVCASREGEVWVANTLGELHSASVQTPPLPTSGDPLFSLACANGGRAWFVNSHGVWAVAGGKVTALPPIPGAPQRRQIKVVATSDHTLYATVAGPFQDGSGIWRYQHRRWTRLPRERELSAGGYATYIDRQDRLWIGFDAGRVIRHSADDAQVLSSGEPGLGFVYAFLDTSRGMFAAGTNGLAVLRDSRLEILKFAEPAFARGVRGLVEARRGDLWLNSSVGFAQVPATELEAGLADPSYPMKARLVRESDLGGAPQRVLGYLDTAARDVEGRLWFATRNGVVRLDPDRITAAAHPPALAMISPPTNPPRTMPTMMITMAAITLGM